MRLRQELVLGIGGVRALRALGIDPAVWHLNEGHSAFLLVERARELLAVDRASPLDEALDAGRARCRLHDPYPGPGRQRALRRATSSRPPLAAAGSTPARMEPDELLELGRGRTDEPNAPFDMTAFSLRHASGANAVSPAPRPDRQRRPGGTCAGHPIVGITNGVHVPTWLGRPVRRAIRTRRCGADWRSTSTGPRAARQPGRPRRLGAVGGPRAPEARAGRLRPRAPAQPVRPPRRGADGAARSSSVLDPDALTIGFARRFATYKRASLLFTRHRPPGAPAVGRGAPGADRLRRQGPPGRPARPAGASRRSSSGRARAELRGRVFILEDYDIRIAPLPRRRASTSGSTTRAARWRRPGTSGMKAAHERRPQLSASSTAGGTRATTATTAGRSAAARPNPDEGAQDWADAQDLYRLLEEEIVPAYYERDATGCRRAGSRSCAARWPALWRFSTTRMLHEYAERLYLPAVRTPVEA